MSVSRSSRGSVLTVRDIMRRDAPLATRGETANAAWERLRALKAEHLVVVENDEVVGTVAAHDLSGPAGGSHRRMARTVGDLMRADVVVATPATTVTRAAALMRKRSVGCLPVVERGTVVGMVTTYEMLGVLARRA